MKRIAGLFFLLTLLMTAMSCNSSKKMAENPLLKAWDTPFGVPPFDLIQPRDYLPAFKASMEAHLKEIDLIATSPEKPSFENVILAFDGAGVQLEKISAVFSLTSKAEMTPELKDIQEKIVTLKSQHYDSIWMREDLFQKIKAVYDERKALKLGNVEMRLLEKIFQEFVRRGALLSDEGKERLKEINEELSVLSVEFGNNLLAENSEYKLVVDDQQLDGLPAVVRESAEARARKEGDMGKWVFTLQKPSFLPFMTYSSERELRRELYEAYLNRCQNDDERDNRQIVNDIMRLRTERAHLLGYDSHADFVTDVQMAKSPREVYKLLDEVWELALPKAKEEMAKMQELFLRDNPNQKFEKWDWFYYANQLRKKNFAVDEEVLRPYFSLDNVLGGVFFLANRLYGITFRPINVPTYHRDVAAYEVMDKDESHLGVLYFDFYARKTKSQGAWCGRYVQQRYEDGKRVAPVVVVVTNFNRPVTSVPTLLALDEVRTVFHEFGHALHSLFRDVKYRTLTNVEGDFVELPSKVMENWAFEPELLRQYAFHHRSSDAMPRYMIDKLRRASKFNQGFKTVELLAASYLDMDIHSLKEWRDLSVEAFTHDRLNEFRGLIPEIEPRYRLPYFQHIFNGGYSAGYYFYTWAEVLDKDAYEAFRETGDIFNRKVAQAFRKEVLEKGGMLDGRTLYRNFRGHLPDTKPLLRSKGFYVDPEPEPVEESSSEKESLEEVNENKD